MTRVRRGEVEMIKLNIRMIKLCIEITRTSDNVIRHSKMYIQSGSHIRTYVHTHVRTYRQTGVQHVPN